MGATHSRPFLQAPGLLSFAVLSQTDERISTPQQFARAISQITDSRTQSNVAASTFILAGLILEEEAMSASLAKGHDARISHLSKQKATRRRFDRWRLIC